MRSVIIKVPSKFKNAAYGGNTNTFYSSPQYWTSYLMHNDTKVSCTQSNGASPNWYSNYLTEKGWEKQNSKLVSNELEMEFKKGDHALYVHAFTYEYLLISHLRNFVHWRDVEDNWDVFERKLSLVSESASPTPPATTPPATTPPATTPPATTPPATTPPATTPPATTPPSSTKVKRIMLYILITIMALCICSSMIYLFLNSNDEGQV